MRTPQLTLPDGTRLGSQVSELVFAALERQELMAGLPPRPKGFIRFQDSRGGIHDMPERFINEGLGIDQRWCYAHGRPQRFAVLENDTLRALDRRLLRMIYQLVLATMGY